MIYSYLTIGLTILLFAAIWWACLPRKKLEYRVNRKGGVWAIEVFIPGIGEWCEVSFGYLTKEKAEAQIAKWQE